MALAAVSGRDARVVNQRNAQPRVTGAQRSPEVPTIEPGEGVGLGRAVDQ